MFVNYCACRAQSVCVALFQASIIITSRQIKSLYFIFSTLLLLNGESTKKWTPSFRLKPIGFSSSEETFGRMSKLLFSVQWMGSVLLRNQMTTKCLYKIVCNVCLLNKTGWVNDDRRLIFGSTIPLSRENNIYLRVESITSVHRV